MSNAGKARGKQTHANNSKDGGTKNVKVNSKSQHSIPDQYIELSPANGLAHEQAAIYKSETARKNAASAFKAGAPSGVSVLGRKSESQMTSTEKMHVTREGISKKELLQLKEKAGLDYDQLSFILGAARATLINKKGSEKFSPLLSEKIMSLADIYSYGYEVFGGMDVFNQWIFQPLPALGSKKPYDLLNNQYGREEVFHIIGRIAYGVYS